MAKLRTKIEVPRLRFRSGASQVELVDLSELCRPPYHCERSRNNASDADGEFTSVPSQLWKAFQVMTQACECN